MNIEPNKAVLIWFQCWMKYCLMKRTLTLSWRIISDIMLSLSLRVVPCCLRTANKVCNVWCISIWVMMYQFQQHSCPELYCGTNLCVQMFFIFLNTLVSLNYIIHSLLKFLCYSLLPLLLHLFQVLTLVTRRHVNLCLVKRRINNYPSLTCPETLDLCPFNNAESCKRQMSVDPAHQNCQNCFFCFRIYHFLATKSLATAIPVQHRSSTSLMWLMLKSLFGSEFCLFH